MRMRSSLPLSSEMPRRKGLPLRVLCTLVVSAVIGICSCVLSADRGAPTRNASQSRQDDSQPKAPARKPSATAPNKFALVVAGVGGEEAYTKKFTAQATRLYEALT